jgi:hypothetical protein
VIELEIWTTLGIAATAIGVPAIMTYVMPPGMVKKEDAVIAAVASSLIVAFIASALPKVISKAVPSAQTSQTTYYEIVKVD